MSDPISFTSTTPRHGLPFLFAAQAQKEFYVNQAHALADMLLHPAIEGESNAPPASPQVGACWLVGSAPTGDWAGEAGKLACRQSASWLFCAPANGMTVLDQSTGQHIRYADGWHKAATVATPSGGTTVDAEARSAIGALIAALVTAGVLPSL